MRNILCLFLGIILFTNVGAQTDTSWFNTPGIIYTPFKVGIGKNNPNAKLDIEGSLKISNDSSYLTLTYNRITSSDDIIFFGDSSLIFNNPVNQIGNSFTTAFFGPVNGLTLGNSTIIAANTIAQGLNSVAMGFNVSTFFKADYAITIGKNILNTTSNSLSIGFSSNLGFTVPTFFVGPEVSDGNTGNVGIGTSSPEDKLQMRFQNNATSFAIGTAFSPTLNNGTTYIGFNAVRSGSTWKTYAEGSKNGASIIYGNIDGNIYLSSIPSTGSSDQTGISDGTILSNTKLFIDGKTGQIGIGVNPVITSEFVHIKQTMSGFANQYTLHVENPQNSNGLLITCGTTATGSGDIGTILNCITNENREIFKVKASGVTYARELKVNLAPGWPDYVFASDYKLNPLENVEKYFKLYGHLEGVPSAAEVEKEGINVAQMDAILLKKVEELFLYVIELKKENVLLREELEKIRTK